MILVDLYQSFCNGVATQDMVVMYGLTWGAVCGYEDANSSCALVKERMDVAWRYSNDIVAGRAFGYTISPSLER